MADNVIKVSVTSTKSQRVSVSSSQQATNITASPDTGRFWSQTSKNWAVSENIVDGEDYSSKYYANKSKGYAQNAENFESATRETYNSFVSDANDYRSELTELKDAGVVEINEAVASGKDEINSAKTTIINDIEFVADGEKKEIEDLIDNGKEELKESIGDVKVLTTLEIGDIGIAPLGIDETKGKRRYLNGQLIIQDQYVEFTKKVKSAVALYPSLACTESEWQTTATMTVGGQVGKFVVDDEAGTIRLPKIIMPIQGLTDLSKLGEIVEAGLPNITGDSGDAFKSDSTSDNSSGCLKMTNYSNSGSFDNGFNGNTGFTIDASLSNPIYGNSNTVQQEQIQYPYFIQVATGAETEDNIINEIELNNPYSFGDSKYSPVALNNLSWLKSEGQYNPKAVYPAYYDWALTNFNNGVEGFALSTGEYTDYDVVINPVEETFRLPLLDGSEDLPSERYDKLTWLATGSIYTAPANGWYYVYRDATSKEQFISIIDTITHNGATQTSFSVNDALRFNYFVKKGEQIKINYSGGTANKFEFIYAQGNGSLYYYVGETVQNSNLINAGRIEEKLTSCITRNECSAYIVETYVNGTSWYRVWSDGWCEQGGKNTSTAATQTQTVTLLKPFKDSNYSISGSDTCGQTAGDKSAKWSVNTLTNSTFNLYFQFVGHSGTTVYWQACGYIA